MKLGDEAVSPGEEAKATVGTPHCAASRTLMGSPSYREVNRLTDAVASTGPTSSTRPMSRMRSPAPTSATTPSRAARSCPSP